MTKSFAYIAITALSIVVMFIVTMDALKYCFDIDPTRKERERLQRKREWKKQRAPLIKRIVYVNASPPQTSNQKVGNVASDQCLEQTET